MSLADTSGWIRSLRGPASTEARVLDRLLIEGDLAVTGMVLAEILQGALSDRHWAELWRVLEGVPYLETSQSSWTQAGRVSSQLRRQGITVPLSDLVIGMVAIEHGCQVYTLDEHFERIPGLKLHVPGAAAEPAQ